MCERWTIWGVERRVVTSPWFAAHAADEIGTALASTSILWERYRSFAEAAVDPKVTANPLFTTLNQPGIGEYLAPGLPYSIGGDRVPATPSPALGDDTADVLSGLGISPEELSRLRESGTIATGSAG